MTANIIRVDNDNKEQLYAYCSTHAVEHDSSYVAGRDFELSSEYPSYLLMENGKVTGAVSLMRTKRFLSVDKGRFAILHSKKGDLAAYQELIKAIRPHMDDLQDVFMFIPEKNEAAAEILKELGFEIDRYSFILERSGPALSEPVFPENIFVHPLDLADNEGINQFADCLNNEFKDLAGHTTNTAEDIQTWFKDQGYLERGMCLLKKGEDAIGTISMMRDMDDMDAGEILAFGILEEYRGMDLGRNLLRYGINYLVGKGLEPIVLSVNGENHGAIKLYKKEGFLLTESVVSYNLSTKK